MLEYLQGSLYLDAHESSAQTALRLMGRLHSWIIEICEERVLEDQVYESNERHKTTANQASKLLVATNRNWNRGNLHERYVFCLHGWQQGEDAHD